MDYPIIAVALGVLLSPLWLVLLTVYEKYCGLPQPCVVTCPALAAPAAVELCETPAGDRHVTRCSRWPGCQPCTEGCLNRGGWSVWD